MTLLITAVARDGLHLSSDYRLSDNGKPIETTNGAKQLSVRRTRWLAQVSFTGIAKFGRYDTRAWIQDVSGSVHAEAPVDDLVATLVECGTKNLASVTYPEKRLTIVIAAVESGNARLFVVSNWETAFGEMSTVQDEFKSFEVKAGRPLLLVHGNRKALPRAERRRLKRLVTRMAERTELSSAMANANEAASRASGGTISAECWVASLLTDGNSFGTNYGKVPGTPADIFAGGFDVAAWIAREFPAAPGKKLTLVQSVGYMGPGTPAPTEIGEPRPLLIESPSASFKRDANGRSFCTVAMSGIKSTLTVRKNENALTSFGSIVVTGDFAVLRSMKCFSLKRAQLPCPPTIDGAQPRTWNYSLDITYDGKELTVVVAMMSVAFRSVNLPAPLPVLGENEELVMVAPTDMLMLGVTEQQPTIAASLRARFLLRDFPELNQRVNV